LEVKSITDWATGRRIEPRELSGRRLLAASGIGNPSSFERTLADLGVVMVGHRVFPDHHPFTEEDLASLEAERIRLNAAQVVTTEKDSVRISELAEGVRAPLLVVNVRLKILSGEEIVDECLGRVLEKARNRGL
jgi:tetraacyldisaccharide-1-P 4'-kinase